MCLLYILHSDITALARDKAYAQIRLDEMTIHQVIAKLMDCCGCGGVVISLFSRIEK